MVSLAESGELFINPKHPYTEALLSPSPLQVRPQVCRIASPAGEEAAPARFALCHFAKDLGFGGVESRLDAQVAARQARAEAVENEEAAAGRATPIDETPTP